MSESKIRAALREFRSGNAYSSWDDARVERFILGYAEVILEALGDVVESPKDAEIALLAEECAARGPGRSSLSFIERAALAAMPILAEDFTVDETNDAFAARCWLVADAMEAERLKREK